MRFKTPASLFNGEPHNITLRFMFSNDLRKVVSKCLESPEIFVKIPQKLEVSNRTIRRSQVFLHF
jgi:hypothetical protein